MSKTTIRLCCSFLATDGGFDYLPLYLTPHSQSEIPHLVQPPADATHSISSVDQLGCFNLTLIL